MAARTDAARAEVVAAREGLSDEVVRLEAAGRAAVDIPARLRREPAKVVGAAAGAAFLLAGGPGRLLRRLTGRDRKGDDSILPDAILGSLKKRGEDGAKSRKALEKDFAEYLAKRGGKDTGAALAIGGTAAQLISNILKPVTQRAGKRLAEELFEADRETSKDALRRAKERDADSRFGTRGHDR